jgi:hypothetical protein
VVNTPEDGYTSAKSVETLYRLIDRNMQYLNSK